MAGTGLKKWRPAKLCSRQYTASTAAESAGDRQQPCKRDALGLASIGTGLGNLGDRERRGVRGEDGRGGGLLVKVAKQVTLNLNVLDDGLDNKVGVGDGLLGVGGGLNVGQDALGEALDVLGGLLLGDTRHRLGDNVQAVPVNVSGFDLASCDFGLPGARRQRGAGARVRPAAPLHSTTHSWCAKTAGYLLKSLVSDIAEGDLEVGLGRDLGNTRTHEAGTEDGDTVDIAVDLRGREVTRGDGGAGRSRDVRGAKGGAGEGGEHCVRARWRCERERGAKKQARQQARVSSSTVGSDERETQYPHPSITGLRR